jgi:hypothetical protein
MSLPEGLDQLNLARQMIGIVGGEAVQFAKQCWGDNLRLIMLHALDHAMADPTDHFEIGLLFEPIDQEGDRGWSDPRRRGCGSGAPHPGH